MIAVDERIAGMTAHWEREGFGWYAFCDRESGALLACGGSHRRHVGGSVVSFTLPGNLASRRVMEKLGFRFERETTYAGLPHVLYRLRVSPV